MISLIIECCKTDQNTTNIKKFISDIHNWKEFINLAFSHGVFPLVYHTLKTHDKLIANDILKSMKTYNRNIAQQNMLMSAELIKLMKLLKENNIEAIAFKGPTLAKIAYGDIALRQYVDLDILVNKNVIDKTEKLLETIFYKPEHILEMYQKKKLEDVVHDRAFQNIKNNVRVECHWVLSSGEFFIDMNKWNDLQSPTFQAIQNKPIPTLSNEKLLVYLCVHGYKHMWERVEWLVDIVMLDLNNDIDYKDVLKIAKNIDANRVVLSSLILCQKILNMHLSNEIKKCIKNEKKLLNISDKMLSKIIATYNNPSKKSQHSKQMSLLQFLILTTYKSKFQYLKTLLSPTENDYQIVKLPKYLNFVYYLIRPFNILFKF